MRPKEYMMQYQRSMERVRQIEARIESLYLQAEIQASAIKADVIKARGQKQDRTGDIAVKIADMTVRLNDNRLKALRLAEEVSAVIDAVPDPIQSRILFDRYIGGMSWSDIADDIGYDPAHTRGRLHGAALESVRKILEAKK